MTLPAIGALAPTFTLPDQRGEAHSLEDYRGSIVVLYFYPRAMTPGCTLQARGLRDSEQALRDLGVKALGLSPDPTKRLAKFTERDQLNFTLLSDEGHAVAEKYGAWGLKKFMGREYMGLKRITFIIDREGRVQHIMEKVKTKTHHSDVLRYIQENMQGG